MIYEQEMVVVQAAKEFKGGMETLLALSPRTAVLHLRVATMSYTPDGSPTINIPVPPPLTDEVPGTVKI